MKPSEDLAFRGLGKRLVVSEAFFELFVDGLPVEPNFGNNKDEVANEDDFGNDG